MAPTKSRQAKSWQSRIAKPNDALAQEFVQSLAYDMRLDRQDIAGSLAHAQMLYRQGLITRRDLASIRRGLKSIARDIDRGKFPLDPGLEDIHMAIEAALIRRTGQAGRKLHTGRSRNDQVALDLALWIRQEGTPQLRRQLLEACRALVELARRSRNIVMPAYTHLQRAQPIAAGAEALAWARMLARDHERIEHCASHRSSVFGPMDDSPLGAGAIAGTSLRIDAAATARWLGFDGPPVSSIEQTASRDLAAELLFAMAMISMHLSRWAEQWIIYSSSEFAFIHIADRYMTGSSMMPQKRNPDMLELIRGRCGVVYGDLVALLTILKGLPIGYNRDLQEDKRLLFDAYDTATSCLTMATAVIRSARLRPRQIEAALERGFQDATSLAEYLVRRGVPFRTAHQIVGALVARCEKQKKAALADLAPADIQAEARRHGHIVRVGRDVYRSLGAANVVRGYRSAGAAGGKALADQLKWWERVLARAK